MLFQLIRLLLLTLCALLPMLTAHGQEAIPPRHLAAKKQLQRLAADMTASCLSDVQSLADWEKKRPELRRQLLEMLGLDPLPPRTPLHARITGTVERTSYRVENIVLQSMPGLYVTGNLYIPKGRDMPLPAVLYLCGHHPHPLGAKIQYQDRAIWFATHGYVCFILDTLEFGEVAGIHHGTHSLNMWNWFSQGYTPAGVEVWNAIRAIDYLETRKEVDAKRIGLTGISGGGAMTWYTAAVDERVAAAAPVCSAFTYGAQANDWVAKGQCDCIYYNNTYQWDFPVVGALIAPRPLIMMNGQKDGIFPPGGYHEVYRKAKRIYDLYAAKDERIREVDDNVEHSDAPLFLKEARLWMQHWLKGEPFDVAAASDKPAHERAEDLACLAEIPKDATNFRIHNQFTKTAKPKSPEALAAWNQRRARLLADLKEKSFHWFPVAKCRFEAEVIGKSGSWADRYGYANFKDYTFQTEDRVRVRAQLYTPKNKSTPPLLMYVRRAADSVASSFVDEFHPLMGEYAILVLNPRFSEYAMSPPDYADMERTAVFTGRTIASLQVWDILRAIEWAVTEQNVSPSGVTLFGRGEMGIACLYAALFDDRAGHVILNDAPGSHWQGPALLNVLRVTDSAEAAGALAPRRLTSLTPWPGSFQLTRDIYGLHGASNRLTQGDSLVDLLGAAVNGTAKR